MKKDWQFEEEELKYKDPILSISHRRYNYSKLNEPFTFTVQNMNNWAIIIPITEEGNLLLVRQYRAGTDSDMIEFPGGSIDMGEESLAAAERELLEETGYKPNKIVKLAVIDPNPAFMRNKCNVFLALGCRRVSKQKLDRFEDAEPFEMSRQELQNSIISGTFTHCISLAAYSLYMLSEYY